MVVARVEDFKPGERRIVELGRRSVGVFRVGDRFYALNNRCPHQGGPLCLGRVSPWVTSDGPGEFRMDEQDSLLACPWHGWEYDLATGQSFLGPGEAPVRSYDVSVQPGCGDGLAEAPAVRRYGRVPGPYVAETFTVTVEDEYVVVHTRPEGRPAPSAQRSGTTGQTERPAGDPQDQQ